MPRGTPKAVATVKGTANVYIIAIPELFYTVQIIFHRNLEVIPLLMVATAWYLVILTVLSVIQFRIERHFARGSVRNVRSSLLSRLKSASRGRQSDLSPRSVDSSLVRWSQTEGRGADLSIHGVSKSFGHLKVLKNVSLEIAAGSVTVILGQSGSGKSTLLRTINHLERVDSGFIAIDGDLIGYRQKAGKLYELKEKDILPKRAEVGMVFQSFNLFPHLTVFENIIEAPVAHGVPRAEAIKTAHELLARVGPRADNCSQ